MALKNFCFAHTTLTVIPPPDTTIIWSGLQPIDQRFAHCTIRVGDHYNDLDALHPFLSGSAGTFALRRLLAESKIPYQEDDLIHLFQFRKFIAAHAIGKPAPNYPGMQIVSEAELATSISHWMEMLFPHATTTSIPYLLSQPVGLHHLFHQYGCAHKPEDLLRYAAIAIEIGVLSHEQVWELFTLPHIIPGGVEFGVLPINTFLGITHKLEQIALAFLKKHLPVDMSPYQRRALSFCTERLGSYFLQKELMHRYGTDLPHGAFGWMHTVDNQGSYTVLRR